HARHHYVEKDAEGVHAHHAEERGAGVPGLVEGGGQRKQRADKRQNAERAAAGALVHERIEQHDHGAEEGEYQLGQDADVVAGGNHRVTWVAICATAWRSGSSAARTAGSMPPSHRFGRTPITSAITTSGISARRSRPTASGRAALAGLRTSP